MKARRRPKPTKPNLAHRAVGGQVLELRRSGIRLLTYWELVTPKIAEFYLQHNIGNRTLSEARVEEMAGDNESGRWHITHQGIAFDVDGNLVDGQHRLRQIAKSGKAVYLLVTRGLPREHVRGIDVGKTRSPIDHSRVLELGVSRRCAACARSMVRVTRPGKGFVSVPHVLGFIERHEGQINAALKALSPPVIGITTAGVDAAFAWSVNAMENGQLERAAAVLREGQPPEDTFKPGDKTMLTLRKYLINLRLRRGGHGGSTQQWHTYRRVSYALRCFMDGRDITNLRVPEEFVGMHAEGMVEDE